MSTAWSILSKRYGGDIRSPTREELSQAIAELYVEAHQGMNEADYEEHGAAFLRYGYDDGPMYVLTIARTATATLEQWADQDYSKELCEPTAIHAVAAERALLLWQLLRDGQIAEVQAAFNSA